MKHALTGAPRQRARRADRARRSAAFWPVLASIRRGTLNHGARIAARGSRTAAQLRRIAGRGSGADQCRIGGRGAGIAARGTFQPAGGRRGAPDYTRKKDTKNPALGGVDRIELSDQTWKVKVPPSITSRTMSRVRSSSGSLECSATASEKL